MIFFCPRCWKEIKGEDKKCPFCGADITEHKRKNFEEKLINALNHPERETIQRAVWILGRLKSVKAVQPLISLFKQTDNPYIKIEILNTLKEIGTTDAINLIEKAIDTEISMVRKKVKELMKKTYK